MLLPNTGPDWAARRWITDSYGAIARCQLQAYRHTPETLGLVPSQLNNPAMVLNGLTVWWSDYGDNCKALRDDVASRMSPIPGQCP